MEECNRFEKTVGHNKPTNLYHYTSIEALNAIINSIDRDGEFFTLRATHASYLNDLTEGALLPETFRQLGVKDFLLQLLPTMEGYPFVLSLSQLENDLNMWRCYANEGCGVTLGIDYEKLSEAFPQQLKQCSYVDAEKLFDKYNTPEVKKAIEDKNLIPLAKLLRDIYYYKHPSFQAEREWRILERWIPDDFTIQKGTLTPYLPLKIPVAALNSITFGPKCDFERNRFAFARMLKGKVKTEDDASRIQFLSSDIPLV